MEGRGVQAAVRAPEERVDRNGTVWAFCDALHEARVGLHADGNDHDVACAGCYKIAEKEGCDARCYKSAEKEGRDVHGREEPSVRVTEFALLSLPVMVLTPVP